MYQLSTNYRNFVDHSSFSNPVINQVECVLLLDDSQSQDLNKVLPGPKQVQSMKDQVLNYLIAYARFVLQDQVISEAELYDFTALKRIFRIQQGDFMTFKHSEVQALLRQQFFNMYVDKKIDSKEAITSVKLQIMFDLSFDQFEALKQDQVISALMQGADPKDLDISKLP